jgi:hypothetical protein
VVAAFFTALAGCAALPNVPDIDELSYGESPPPELSLASMGIAPNPNKAHFQVQGDDVDAFYLVQQSLWRNLPADPARREKAMQDAGFGPRAVNTIVTVQKRHDYYFIPICGSRAAVDRMRFLAAGRLDRIVVAVLRCRL